MASYTAQILVGSGHSYDNEGINPFIALSLSENSRPAWILPLAGRTITWIPTIETMLEDGLLMLYLYVEQNEKILNLVKESFFKRDKDWYELYDDVKREELSQLHQECRKTPFGYKLILNIFHKSTILKQIHVLQEYSFDLEVTVPIFIRYRSGWNQEIYEEGSLAKGYLLNE